MVAMATPDMQAALVPEPGVCSMADGSGFQNASATLVRTFLEYFLSEVCHRTLLALLQGFWCVLISDGDAATPDELKRANMLYWPSLFKGELVRWRVEAAFVKDNLGSCVEFLNGIKSERHSLRGMRPEKSQQCNTLSISSRTRPFLNGMEEENDLTERCKVRSQELIEGLHILGNVTRKQTASWILAAKNKDDDEDEEDEDDEDEDEEYGDDEDDDGEGGDDEEDDEDGGAGGDGGDGAKDGEDDDDAEDEEEGDYEEDEDDEDVDDESSSDEDETPPKKLKK